MLLRFASVWLAADLLLVSALFFLSALAQNSGIAPQPLATPDTGHLEESIAGYEKILSSPGTTDPRSLTKIRTQLATAHLLLHRYADSLHDLEPLESGAGNQMSAQAWTIKGLDELELNQLPQAVHSLQLAMRLNPRSATARLALGDALARTGRMDEAAREYDQQTRLTPSLTDAWYKLGLAHSQISANLTHEQAKPSEQGIVQQLTAEELLAQGDNLNAAKLLLRLVRSSPGQPDAHAELGSALLALGYSAAARDHFEQELINNPESPVAELGLVQTGALADDWDKVSRRLEHLSTTQPKELLRLLEFPPAGLVQQAWTAGQLKPSPSFTDSHAGTIWTSWLSDSNLVPKLSEKENHGAADACPVQPRNLRAGVWLTERCYLILAARIRASRNPTATVQLKLEEAEFRLGQYDAALRLARKLRADDPHSGWALYWLSKAHDAIAEQCFVKVGLLNPDSARVHQMLAEHYLKLSDYPKSQAEFLSAVRLSPDSADLHLGLGTSLSRGGDLEKAERELKTALQLSPESAFAHYELGHLYLRQEQWQQSIEQLEQVSADSTMLLNARLDLAKAESEIGERPKAIRDLLSIASLDRDGEVYFRLAALYRSMGDTTRARDALNTFRQRRAESLQTDTEELGALEKEQEIGRAAIPPTN